MKRIEKYLKEVYPRCIGHRVYAIDSEYLYIKAVNKESGEMQEIVMSLTRLREKVKLGK